MHFPFFWEWGVWGPLSGKMLSTECFLMGFSVAHVFHNKKTIFAGVEKLTEKIVQTHRKIPKKAQSCAAWLFITAVSSLAFRVGAASAHTSKGDFVLSGQVQRSAKIPRQTPVPKG